MEHQHEAGGIATVSSGGARARGLKPRRWKCEEKQDIGLDLKYLFPKLFIY